MRHRTVPAPPIEPHRPGLHFPKSPADFLYRRFGLAVCGNWESRLGPCFLSLGLSSLLELSLPLLNLPQAHSCICLGDDHWPEAGSWFSGIRTGCQPPPPPPAAEPSLPVHIRSPVSSLAGVHLSLLLSFEGKACPAAEQDMLLGVMRWD